MSRPRQRHRPKPPLEAPPWTRPGQDALPDSAGLRSSSGAKRRPCRAKERGAPLIEINAPRRTNFGKQVHPQHERFEPNFSRISAIFQDLTCRLLFHCRARAAAVTEGMRQYANGMGTAACAGAAQAARGVGPQPITAISTLDETRCAHLQVTMIIRLLLLSSVGALPLFSHLVAAHMG